MTTVGALRLRKANEKYLEGIRGLREREGPLTA